MKNEINLEMVINKYDNPKTYNLNMPEAIDKIFNGKTIICKTAIYNGFNDYVYSADIDSKAIIETSILYKNYKGEYSSCKIFPKMDEDLEPIEMRVKRFATISPNELSALRTSLNPDYSKNLFQKYGKPVDEESKIDTRNEDENQEKEALVEEFLSKLFSDDFSGSKDVEVKKERKPLAKKKPSNGCLNSKLMLDFMINMASSTKELDVDEYTFKDALKKLVKSSKKKHRTLYMVNNNAKFSNFYIKYQGSYEKWLYDFISGKVKLEDTFDDYISSDEFDGTLFEANGITLRTILDTDKSINEANLAEYWDIAINSDDWVLLDLAEFMSLKAYLLMNEYVEKLGEANKMAEVDNEEPSKKEIDEMLKGKTDMDIYEVFDILLR